MIEPTDAELDAVLCSHWPAFSMQATLVRMWVRAAMRAAIAKWGTPPAVAGEPVSWQYQGPDGLWHDFIDARHRKNTVDSGEWPIRALYATPQPTQAAPLQPLTEAELSELADSLRFAGEDGWQIDAIAISRAI